ncbi:hypothetical protein LNV37_07630, partial [Klebsiella pneumoniae]|nr:hypothetical protein [Klebsiella pneumoniae]MCJ4989558.1 hypothetical protein [Klebsiella pneumoniae]
SAQIREILISESAWEEMTCLFAPSLNRLHSRQHNSSRRTNLLNNRRCFSAVFSGEHYAAALSF